MQPIRFIVEHLEADNKGDSAVTLKMITDTPSLSQVQTEIILEFKDAGYSDFMPGRIYEMTLTAVD